MKAKTFDKQFDDNQDISNILDMSKTKRPNQEQRRVNVDFPNWMITSLDKEAKYLAVIPIPISLYLNSPPPRLLQQEKEYRRTYWDWCYSSIYY